MFASGDISRGADAAGSNVVGILRAPGRRGSGQNVTILSRQPSGQQMTDNDVGGNNNQKGGHLRPPGQLQVPQINLDLGSNNVTQISPRSGQPRPSTGYYSSSVNNNITALTNSAALTNAADILNSSGNSYRKYLQGNKEPQNNQKPQSVAQAMQENQRKHDELARMFHDDDDGESAGRYGLGSNTGDN